jgi:lysozyme
MLKGIDVSRWQGTINWNLVRPNIDFAIIKAGGSDVGKYTDPMFSRNRGEAKRVGVLVIGYYYFIGGGDPETEAKHFFDIVGNLSGSEFVALDFEIAHNDPVGYSLRFLRKAESYFGLKPMFYTNMGRVWQYDWSPVVRNNNGLWGAIFDGNANSMPNAQEWPVIAIKQYTSSGRIAGITENTVDMDTFNGTMGQLLAYCKKGSSGAPVATTAPTLAPQPKSNAYTIVKGDTLSGIASRNGLTLQQLLNSNPQFRANPNLIYPGQVVYLASHPVVQTSGLTYVIKKGDTLSGIAAKFGISLQTLLNNNPQFKSHPNLIFPNEVLKIK